MLKLVLYNMQDLTFIDKNLLHKICVCVWMTFWDSFYFLYQMYKTEYSSIEAATIIVSNFKTSNIIWQT